jgi:hypothetical protein
MNFVIVKIVDEELENIDTQKKKLSKLANK